MRFFEHNVTLRATGALIGISIDGYKVPKKSLGISIDGFKLPFNPCFHQKLMGAIRPYSKLMGAIAPIDPP